MLSEKSTITATKDQVSCDLAGEAVILHLKSGVYYGLDPVGARIWTLVQEPKTFTDLRDTLVDEYDVETAKLEGDLRDLLNKLAEQGLVEISE